MPLSCYDKHRKPVCDKCNAGYYCTKCCKCQNLKHGRPRKVSIEQPEPAVRSKLRMEDTVTVHLPEKILAVYKSIGSKPQAPSASYKRGRPLNNTGVSGRDKAKVCYSDCDKQKDLSKWNKQELQAYLIHHNLKKSGNKSDLLLHISGYRLMLIYYAYLPGLTRTCRCNNH